MDAARARRWLERHQVLLYLAAILVGLGAGAVLPGAGAIEVAVEPTLAALLLVTFLGIPLTRLRAAFRDWRFLLTLLALNFALVPLIVLVLTLPLADRPDLLIGALLVLLAPCIDYVIVFAALAGGAHERLLAATPVLMLGQLLALPVLLPLMSGTDVTELIEPGPFVRAFVLLILVPLVGAAVLQRLAPRLDLSGAMVPLMVLVLVTVAASQADVVVAAGSALLALVPLYAAFLVVATAVGVLVSRLARMGVASARAVTFSGATRNSLVVLPIALAMPPALALVPAVVVTQTMVELVGMAVLVRLVPRLIPDRSRRRG